MPAALRRTRPAQPRYALAWFPRFEGIERIEAFRERHDPMAPLIPAHLTLVFPFPSAHSRLQVETHVRRVVSGWPPIPVTFRAMRMQANEFVFLMASRGAAALTQLHDNLYTRSLQPHLRRDLPYEPHITLARNADFAALEKTFEEAREQLGAEFADILRSVTLLAVGRDGKIERLKDISLNTA
jgi:2'-5' RNA ligase